MIMALALVLTQLMVCAGVTIQYTKINSNPTEYVQSSSLTTKSVSLVALRRTNWCSQWGYVRSGGDPLYALNGRNVTAAITATDPFYLNTSSTGFPASGYMWDVLAEVARRGKFNWVFVIVDGYSNVAAKELPWLQKVLPRVDMVVNKPYIDLAVNRAAGVGYTLPLLDASLVLITVQSSGRASAPWFSFLKPFNFTLWACILGVIIFQGVLHYVMNPVWRSDGSKVSLFIVVFKSLGTFTGSTSQGPVRPGASIVQMGYSFFLLILLSAYTANLTSFFVIVPNYNTPFASIDDANSLGASICAQNGTAAYSVLQSSYKNIQIVAVSKKFTSTQLLMELSRPQPRCSGAVLNKNDWEINQINAAANPNCNLVQVGQNIRAIDAGWPYLVDYNRNCTSLVEAAVSEAIVSMTLDGTLDTLFYDHVSAAASIDCSGATTDNPQSAQLTEVTMAGVFLIYCAFVFLAVTAMLFQVQGGGWCGVFGPSEKKNGVVRAHPGTLSYCRLLLCSCFMRSTKRGRSKGGRRRLSLRKVGRRGRKAGASRAGRARGRGKRRHPKGVGARPRGVGQRRPKRRKKAAETSRRRRGRRPGKRAHHQRKTTAGGHFFGSAP